MPDGWGDFDVAFSHEVLYLLEDLRAHAAGLFGALKPSGSYFAVMGVHAESRMMSAWHAESAVELNLPRLYQLDEVARDFEDAGFSVSVANLKLGFVPVSAHRHGHEPSEQTFSPGWTITAGRRSCSGSLDRPPNREIGRDGLPAAAVDMEASY